MKISLKPINYTGNNTDVCTLSRVILEGVRVLALLSSNSPHRKETPPGAGNDPGTSKQREKGGWKESRRKSIEGRIL